MKYKTTSFRPIVQKLKYDNEIVQVLIGPLEKGFSNSFANVLRRIILRFTPGVSIIGIKIKNTSYSYLHPYTVIPGTKENISEVLGNMKNILIKPISYSPIIFPVIKRGPCIIRAKDLLHTDNINILNEDAYVCCLENDMQIEWNIYADFGCGFIPANYFGKKKDTVYADTTFSPVVHFSFYIRSYSTYEDLILQIKTNGTCDPYFVVTNAFDFLYNKITPRFI